MGIQEYLTLKKEAEYEIVVKKSKFIANVKPVSTLKEAEEFISKIKKRYYDATHNTYAFTVGLEAEEVQKSNDDGEPSGTAGKPILEVIKMKNLKNTIVVVTRYFGGILLGAGGLIRAYSESAREGIEKAGITKMIRCEKYLVSLNYQNFNRLERYFKEKGFIIKGIEYKETVNLEVLRPYYLPLTVEEVLTKMCILDRRIILIGEGFEEIVNNKFIM